MSTAIKQKSPADHYAWQVHLYKGCYVLYRWVRSGRERRIEPWGGSKQGKPLKLFASIEEAIAKCEELNA